MGVLLGGLLEAWLVGPIYGANVVLFVMLFYLLTLRGSRGSKRSLPLLLVVGLLSVTTTAQAFTLLADIIVGFVKAPNATTYFTNEGRMAKFLTLIFYLINSEICDLVMTWRVYVLWERNAFILASFILMDFVTFGSGIVGIVELRHAHVFNVHSVHTWTTVTWACSVAIQVTGTLLIAWRAWSTPKTIPAHRTAERYPWAWALLWLLVDSGVLFSFTTLLLLALAFTKPMAFDVMTSALGQIAALVSLSIALRECWKAEHEREQTYVARSLLSDRLPQTSGRPGSRGRDGGMMTTMVVAIQTSQHQRADGDQIFIKEPYHHNLKTKETTDSLASV